MNPRKLRRKYVTTAVHRHNQMLGQVSHAYSAIKGMQRAVTLNTEARSIIPRILDDLYELRSALRERVDPPEAFQLETEDDKR